MVADNKPPAKGFNSDPTRLDLVPCVKCGHDITWHHSRDIGRAWTDEEWEIEKEGTWNKGSCQWDTDDEGACGCKAFKHPEAPRRREAIEHSRRLS